MGGLLFALELAGSAGSCRSLDHCASPDGARGALSRLAALDGDRNASSPVRRYRELLASAAKRSATARVRSGLAGGGRDCIRTDDWWPFYLAQRHIVALRDHSPYRVCGMDDRRRLEPEYAVRVVVEDAFDSQESADDASPRVAGHSCRTERRDPFATARGNRAAQHPAPRGHHELDYGN